MEVFHACDARSSREKNVGVCRGRVWVDYREMCFSGQLLDVHRDRRLGHLGYALCCCKIENAEVERAMMKGDGCKSS